MRIRNKGDIYVNHGVGFDRPGDEAPEVFFGPGHEFEAVLEVFGAASLGLEYHTYHCLHIPSGVRFDLDDWQLPELFTDVDPEELLEGHTFA